MAQATSSESENNFERLLEEHHQLRQLLATLEKFGSIPSGWTSAWSRGAAEGLEELRRRLTDHFRYEESSGLFTAFCVRYPRFATALRRLRSEHTTILVELKHLEQDCRNELDGVESFRLAPRLRALLATIRRHDAEETEIVHRAAFEDIGVGD